MEYSLREVIFMGLSVLAATILIYMSLPMAGMAKEANREYTAAKIEAAAAVEEREWSKYTGTVSGSSMLGFITRHKDSCDIIISNKEWDTRIEPYLTDGDLVLGLSDTKLIPDYFWDAAFLYDVLLGGLGEREYEATLIYNYNTITGIYYREV